MEGTQRRKARRNVDSRLAGLEGGERVWFNVTECIVNKWSNKAFSIFEGQEHPI